MVIYLVAAGDGRYELEPAPAQAGEGPPSSGFWARRLDRLRAAWTRAVEDARRPGSASWRGRQQARLIRHLDEWLEEQRSLWALRDRATATLVYPAELEADQASRALRHLLTDARRHHGWWLVVDTILLALSGLLMLIPGPNLIAYYFGFRVIGHYLSWRGARQALDAVAWTFEPRS